MRSRKGVDVDYSNFHSQRHSTITLEQMTAIPTSSQKHTTISCPSSPHHDIDTHSHIGTYRSVEGLFNRSDWSIALEMLWGRLPQWMITLTHYAPTARFRRLRECMKLSKEVAQALLDRQMAPHAQGTEGSKDIMSILSKCSYRLRWKIYAE